MRIVCSKCQRILHDDGSRADLVERRLCDGCGRAVGRGTRPLGLSQALDRVPAAVLVVDPEGRVLAANAAMARALGRDRDALLGLRGGEAMTCAFALLPEGCGNTVHCRECAIRRTVMAVYDDGRPRVGVRAYLRASAAALDVVISARPYDGCVQVTVESVGPATRGAA
jgi:PAS domain-containing protein